MLGSIKQIYADFDQKKDYIKCGLVKLKSESSIPRTEGISEQGQEAEVRLDLC